MKYRFLIAILALFIGAQGAQAQLLQTLKQKAKETANQRADDKTTKMTNTTADKADTVTTDAGKKVSGLFKKKNKKDSTASTQGTTTNTTNATGNNTDSVVNNSGASSVTNTPAIASYRNYDFIPGDQIIFQSQLADEKTGEIPSQFDLSHGQMDIQTEDGENVIHVPKGDGATFTPRMTNQTYMPDQFTVEFDFKDESFGIGHLMVDFGNRVYYSAQEGVMPGMTFGTDNTMTWTLGDTQFPNGLDINDNHPMQWHHVAIAINKTAGKVYIDQYRVCSVNNLTGKANNITIDVAGYENSYIKNVRIASGGIDIYKKVTTDGKIIMHGILFNVDKASLKAESMGSINQINDLLKKDPTLKFEIDGHTDNSGAAAHNLTLSQQRADAVKTQLISMGIDASRLTAKGFGDTKPIESNDTPEGKANNRRVEFIKM